MRSPAILIQSFILLFKEKLNCFVHLCINSLKPHIVLIKTKIIIILVFQDEADSSAIWMQNIIPGILYFLYSSIIFSCIELYYELKFSPLPSYSPLPTKLFDAAEIEGWSRRGHLSSEGFFFVNNRSRAP